MLRCRQLTVAEEVLNTFEFLVGLRFTLTGKHDRFVSFVSLLSMLGVALGVAALVVVLSVMTGFQNELRERILGVASHLEALGRGNGVEDWRAVAEVFTQHQEVLAAAPNIQEQGLLTRGNAARGALVHGILPSEEEKVNEVAQHLSAGEWGALRAGAYRILLGTKLAQKLNATVGDKVMLMAPKGRLTAAGFLPRLRRFEVAGIIASGVHQFDSSLAYIHLKDAQQVYQLGDAVTSVRLKLRDVLAAPRLRLELRDAVASVLLYDWTSSHGSLFRALALEKRAMFVILTLIVMVAAFNIMSALVTMVRNKRGEIAILRAMGATGGAITRIFLLQGIFIGGCGVLLGVALGLPLAANVGAVVAWLEAQVGFALFPGDVYQLGRLPSRLVAADVLTVAVTAFIIALVATVWPAWRSGKLSPAESLRHE